MRRDRIESQRKLAGWSVIVDPDQNSINYLIKSRFTGFVLFERSHRQLPWVVWRYGSINCHRATEQEAEAEMVKKAGRRS